MGGGGDPKQGGGGWAWEDGFLIGSGCMYIVHYSCE